MEPGYTTKILASMAIAIVVSAALGYYLIYNFPSQSSTTVGGGLTVNSNKVIAIKLPGHSDTIGIWELQLSNSGNSNLYATYQIFVNGNIAYGNSTLLLPGQQSTIASCTIISFLNHPPVFDVPIFVTNASGTVVPHYPVSLVNLTQVEFSGQFSASNSLHAFVNETIMQRRVNVSTWSISVANLGQKPIKYLYAELWNGTKLIDFTGVRCAGSTLTSTPELPAYGQPVSPGESANATLSIYPGNTPIIAGRTYRVDVIAVYPDDTEVVQSYQVRATS